MSEDTFVDEYDYDGGDREWEDGDDSRLFDNGYRRGVRETLEYLRDELSMTFYDNNVLLRMAGLEAVLCPFGGDNFDCTPFCPKCEGNHEYYIDRESN